jgi:hypothetical protein
MAEWMAIPVDEVYWRRDRQWVMTVARAYAARDGYTGRFRLTRDPDPGRPFLLWLNFQKEYQADPLRP